MSQSNTKFHLHVALCPLAHRRGAPSECGFDFDHFLDADLCRHTHPHTHDGRPCSCTFGHNHEVRCARDHGVANSRNVGGVYLGQRCWTLRNNALDPLDKDFLLKFVAVTPSVLRPLYDLGIDPAEVYSLCLETAPRQNDWPASRAKRIKAGRRLLPTTIEWLRTTANAVPPEAIPPDRISVDIPGPGESMVAKRGVPLPSAAFDEMLATIRENRADKATTTKYKREPWAPPRPQIRSISLPPFGIDPALADALEALEQQLEVISAIRWRSRGAPRDELETSFIRGFTRLARQRTKRPLDALAADLFRMVFSRKLDVEAYTKRRIELETPPSRRGALNRTLDFLKRELAAGPQRVSDLESRAKAQELSRTTLFRAASKLEVERATADGAAYWSLRIDPKASSANSKLS